MGPVLQGILRSPLLVKVLGTLQTVRIERNGALYTFSRSARTEPDEELARLPEDAVARSSGPGLQHMRSAILNQ